MKRTNSMAKIAVLLVFGMLLIPLTGQARGMRGGGYHMMDSGMMSQLTDAEQKIAKEVMQKHYGPMMELKKQLFAKRAEFHALMATEKFDAQKARTLGKEISALHAKMMEQHMEMAIEMREKGVSYYGTCISGGHMDRGMMMDGGMMGPGMMMEGDMMNQNMMHRESK